MKENNENFVEVSRRCEVSEHEGIACGPFFMTSVEAEIVILEDGEKKYLHSSWISEGPESISFEINSESIFDILVNDGDINKLEDIRGASLQKYGEVSPAKYSDVIAELKEMIVSKIRDIGLYDEEDLVVLLENFEN